MFTVPPLLMNAKFPLPPPGTPPVQLAAVAQLLVPAVQVKLTAFTGARLMSRADAEAARMSEGRVFFMVTGWAGWEWVDGTEGGACKYVSEGARAMIGVHIFLLKM